MINLILILILILVTNFISTIKKVKKRFVFTIFYIMSGSLVASQIFDDSLKSKSSKYNFYGFASKKKKSYPVSRITLPNGCIITRYSDGVLSQY